MKFRYSIMSQTKRNIVIQTIAFVAVFAVFCLPIYFVPKKVEPVKAQLIYPQQQREIASMGKTFIEPAQKECEPARRWRYKCDSNSECKKDREETYLRCKSL